MKRWGALSLVLSLAACGDDPADPSPDAADVATDTSDGADTSADTAGDAAADAATDPDTSDVTDTTADADTARDIVDADVTPLAVPFEPAPVGVPLVDAPFLQEINHTTPEVDPRIGPLVDVLLRPTGFEGWPEVLQVTPRGLVQDLGEPLTLAAIPDEDADLLGGASVHGAALLASPNRAYAVDTAGAVTAFDAPNGTVIERVVQGDGRAWLLTSTGPTPFTGVAPSWDLDGPHVVALAEEDGVVVTAAGGGLSAWSSTGTVGDGSPVWTWTTAEDPEFEAIVLDVTQPQALDVVALHADGALGVTLDGTTPSSAEVPLFAADRVPLRNATEALRLADGGFVAVGPEGAWRIMDRGDGPEWRVYPAERWLPNEHATGVASLAQDATSPLYFATQGGLAWVTAEYMTLEEKLAHFVDRVVDRHDRDGAVSDSRLSVRGDLSTSIPWDSDNDGGWTCYWILAECARWQATGAEDARANFDHSLERMLAFQTLTGTDHFLARAVIRRDGCQLDDCDAPDDGEWFLSPDGEWWVKGDTSNDEVISHMFMMGPAYDHCATDEQRAAIRQHVTRIVGGIIDNGWRLVDLDGEMTTYGQFHPAYVNIGVSDAGRKAVAALGMASLAYHVSGEQRFLDARQALIDDHGYADNAQREAEYPLRWGQYSGDNNELSMQAWMALLRYEHDPALLPRWLDGWSRAFAGLAVQEGAMWNVADHLLGGGTATSEAERDALMRWLRTAPVDMIRWDIHNGHRRDLVAPPAHYEQSGRQRSDGRPIPYDERATDRWNTDQYRVDRGMGGWREMDGADVLAPYWLARAAGLIVPSE